MVTIINIYTELHKLSSISRTELEMQILRPYPDLVNETLRGFCPVICSLVGFTAGCDAG